MEENQTVPGVTIIKMDPDSPEWKARISKIKKDLADKNNGEEHEYDSFGYRQN